MLSDRGVVTPHVGTVHAIHSHLVPTTNRKVRPLSWWDGTSPPHRFVDRAAVLTDLTKVSAPNKAKWTAECDRGFKDLRVPSQVSQFSTALTVEITQVG